jgi:hypothetical protein
MIVPVNRKIIPFFVVFLLVGCSGSGSGEIECESFWDGTLGTCLPSEWEHVEPSALQERGIPSEVVAAFQSREPLAGQYPTVTVTREFLSKAFTPSAYSAESIEIVKTLPGYTVLDTNKVRIDDERVVLHSFYAQPSPDGPSYRFYQLSTVANNEGYTYTVAVPRQITEMLEKEILTILENATFVQPRE